MATSNTKLTALAGRRAGVKEALTLIASSPTLPHARLLLEGLLAQIDKEYDDLRSETGRVTKPPAIVVVSDLQDSLARFDPSLDIRVVSPEIHEPIDGVSIRVDDDSRPLAVDIRVGYGPLTGV